MHVWVLLLSTWNSHIINHLYSNKKWEVKNTNTCYKRMNLENIIEWKKTQHLLYDSIYMKDPEQENL